MRPQRSCVNCKKRKQKCDLMLPCSRCIKLGVECTFLSSKPKEKAKLIPKILQKDAIRLEKKWSQLESMVKKYHLDELITDNTPLSDPVLTPETSSSSCAELEENMTVKKLFYYPSKDIPKEYHLVNVFFVYHHNTFPYLNEDRVRKIVVSGDERDMTLISAICSFALKTYEFLLGEEISSIDINPYYKKTRRLLTSDFKPSLSLLQATLISHTMETGNAHPIKSSCLSAECIKMGQILNLHTMNLDLDASKLNDYEKERVKTWIQCLNLDQLSSLFCGKPAYNRLTDLTSIDNDLVHRLINSNSNFILNRQEREYILCQIFYHMVKIKSKLFELNKILTERNYNYEEIRNNLKKIIERIDEINIIDKTANPHFDSININEAFHPNIHYLSYLSLFTFKHTLSTVAHYLLYQLLETGSSSDAIESIKHHSLAKAEGIALIEKIKGAEERFEKLLMNGKGKVIYACHFCPSLGIEWAMLPHVTEQNVCSKKFIGLCSDIFKDFGVFWPTINNLTCRRRISNINL
ncbi:hypothetical protein K502DRAFT_324687 [Neoconidiobolus thromboides FSU 785]|nr:hypothetical protein K502DRAFT_324687 [Neoconidiobolus thromboides FSU 785]